jgi:hypothetical protein
MIMKTRIIYLIATGLLLASCNNATLNKSGLPYHINLEESIDNIKSIPLSTLGSKIEYVPLETDSACLIESITNAFVSDSFIFISDYNRLMLFDKSGKYLKQIGSAGRGPGEYPSVGGFIVDKNHREIYVLSSRIILVYDFEGRFKRDFNIDFPSRQFILDENDRLILHPFNLPHASSEPVYSWYFLDKTGIIQTKLINTLKRKNGGVIVPISPLYMYNGTPHFMEFGVDTLYNYVKHEKKLYAIFQCGNLKFPPDPTMAEVSDINGKIWVSDIRETNKLLFINIWHDLSGPISNCIYDKSSSTFTILKDDGFTNDIDGGMTFWPKKIISDNLMIDYADAFDLISYIKNKDQTENRNQTGQLKDIVNRLTETSNPVIIILKNK